MQELYWDCADSDEFSSALTPLHLSLLARAMTTGLAWTGRTCFTNGMHYIHGSVTVTDMAKVDAKPAAKDGPVRVDEHTFDQCGRIIRWSNFDSVRSILHIFLEPMFIERDRLQSRTLLKIMGMLIPRGGLAVAGSRDIGRPSNFP